MPIAQDPSFDNNGRSIHPIIEFISGSLVVLKPGILSSSFSNDASMSLAIKASASFAIEADPKDKNSVQFRVPADSAGTTNDRIAFYVSSSGNIGIGTKDPETPFDVRDAGEDADPKDRTAKTKILRISKTSQVFDTPVTASIISASNNIHAGGRYFLNDVQILNDAFSVFTVGHQDRTMILHGSAVNLGFGAIPVNASGLVSFTGNVQLGNATSDKVSISSSLFAGSHITASGNISSSGNFMGNNIGSIYEDYIYLTPIDFDHLKDKVGITVAGEVENNGGYLADNNARGTYYAQKMIPKGYKATHVIVEGSSTSDNFKVYSSSYDVGTAVEVGSATSVGTEKAITGVIGGNGTYVSIEWGSRGNTDVYGGYIKLAKS